MFNRKLKERVRELEKTISNAVSNGQLLASDEKLDHRSKTRNQIDIEDNSKEIEILQFRLDTKQHHNSGNTLKIVGSKYVINSVSVEKRSRYRIIISDSGDPFETMLPIDYSYTLTKLKTGEQITMTQTQIEEISK